MSKLLDQAIEAAGGDRWISIREIGASVSLTGALYRIKQQPFGMPEIRLTMSTREPEVKIEPFVAPQEVGHFVPNRVWIETDGRVVEELQDPVCRLMMLC